MDQMGRHPFGVALFVAHSDVFFHIPHYQRRWGYYTETAAAKSSTAKCDYGADEIATDLPRGNGRGELGTHSVS